MTLESNILECHVTYISYNIYIYIYIKVGIMIDLLGAINESSMFVFPGEGRVSKFVFNSKNKFEFGALEISW